MIILKAILAGLLAAGVVLVANYGSHRLAGLLISFPVVLMTSVLVIGKTAGQDVAQSVVRANIIAMPVWLVSVAAIFFTLKHLPILPAMGISLAVWLAAAATFMYVTD